MYFAPWKTLIFNFFLEFCEYWEKRISADKKVVSALNNSPSVTVELWTQLMARGGINRWPKLFLTQARALRGSQELT